MKKGQLFDQTEEFLLFTDASNSKKVAKKMPPKIANRLENQAKKTHLNKNVLGLKWSLTEIKNTRIPLSMASREFGVPKTNVQDHKSVKVLQITGKSGLQPFLTVEGESKLGYNLDLDFQFKKITYLKQ